MYHLGKLNGLPIEVSMLCLAVYQYVCVCVLFPGIFLGDLVKLCRY